MTRVKCIPVSRLVDFAAEAAADFKRYRILPISTTRAISQARNPAAAPDDVALIVAYDDEGVCIGYLGVLPCWFCHHGKQAKVHALSTFYVDEAYRGRQVAKQIMTVAIELDRDLLLAGYTTSAERFYRRHPEWFTYGGELPYLRLHLHPSTSILWKLRRKLGEKNAVLQDIYGINRRLLTAGVGLSWYWLLWPHKSAGFDGLYLKLVEKIPTQSSNCQVDGGSHDPHFVRSPEIINWAIHYPWIIESSEGNGRYEFSHQRSLFRLLPYELHRAEAIEASGYALISLSHKEQFRVVKILDCHPQDAASTQAILNLALQTAFQHRADLLECSQAFWPVVRSHLALRLIAEQRRRGYFLHFASVQSALQEVHGQIRFDYCDSDLSFT